MLPRNRESFLQLSALTQAFLQKSHPHTPDARSSNHSCFDGSPDGPKGPSQTWAGSHSEAPRSEANPAWRSLRAATFQAIPSPQLPRGLSMFGGALRAEGGILLNHQGDKNPGFHRGWFDLARARARLPCAVLPALPDRPRKGRKTPRLTAGSCLDHGTLWRCKLSWDPGHPPDMQRDFPYCYVNFA